MAQLSKPAIPAKMYRQFAIITMATTAGLALFASGPSPSADDGAAARATARSVSATPRTSSTPRYGQARLKTGTTVEVSDGFESFEVAESFAPNTGSRRSINAINAIGATEMAVAGTENAGFSREYLESLSDEELEELVRQLRANGADDPATRAQVIALLNTASRRRSGPANRDQVLIDEPINYD
jgi:hypothetical protein